MSNPKQEALAKIEDKLIQMQLLMKECEELADEHDLTFTMEFGPEGFAYNGKYGYWDDIDGVWVGSNC